MVRRPYAGIIGVSQPGGSRTPAVTLYNSSLEKFQGNIIFSPTVQLIVHLLRLFVFLRIHITLKHRDRSAYTTQIVL
jgi:hypothetical protein